MRGRIQLARSPETQARHGNLPGPDQLRGSQQIPLGNRTDERHIDVGGALVIFALVTAIIVRCLIDIGFVGGRDLSHIRNDIPTSCGGIHGCHQIQRRRFAGRQWPAECPDAATEGS